MPTHTHTHTHTHKAKGMSEPQAPTAKGMLESQAPTTRFYRVCSTYTLTRLVGGSIRQLQPVAVLRGGVRLYLLEVEHLKDRPVRSLSAYDGLAGGRDGG